MPSFDVVSEVDAHELTNAVDQTNRELGNRFDFKGADARVEQEADGLLLEADNDFQVKQIIDILYQKMTKRGIDISSLENKPSEARGMRTRQKIIVRQGIDKELGKKIVKLIKDSKIKVQPSIQGEQVRVSGKKRDDLQQVMALLREAELGQAVQFTNFRD